jgi:hypothetical protein
MADLSRVARQRQFCGRCGQLMFEFFASPDGHFGVVNDLRRVDNNRESDLVRCSVCGAQYRLLDRLNAIGQAVERR